MSDFYLVDPVNDDFGLGDSEGIEDLEETLLSTRPPVTRHEARILQSIVGAIGTDDTPFYISGSLPPELLPPDPTLMYIARRQNAVQPKALSLKNAAITALEELHQDSSPSHFGQGAERVMDESYRLARELPADDFNLNFDSLAPRAGVMSAISAFCRHGTEGILYKLNSYVEGGHFGAHKDTPKGEQHLGTLLIGPATVYEGGALILRHANKSITVDWSTSNRSGDGSIRWLFFYADVEHEILPVASGHRLTISYDVFASDRVAYPGATVARTIDHQYSELYGLVKAGLDDPTFLSGGGKLAFGLSHEYPHKEMEDAVVFEAILKGQDFVLWGTLQQLGLKLQKRAVYQEDCDELRLMEIAEQLESTEKYPLDTFSCVANETILLTAKSFAGLAPDARTDGGTTRWELLEETTGARADWDAIWVQEPSKYVRASTYQAYGNEPTVDHCYVAGAIMAKVPPFGQGCRTRRPGASPA